MIRLSALNIATHISYVLVDGFLVNEDGERRYVEKMKVKSLAVDYHETFDAPTIWLQSMENSELFPETRFDIARSKTWYTLGKPSQSYARYFEPFLWLATFGLHFFSFLDNKEGDVVLLDFKEDFAVWLEDRFWAHEEAHQYYRNWLDKLNDKVDFRIQVAAHEGWLWNQLFGLDNMEERLRNLTIWKEIHTLDAIPPAYKGNHEDLTVVTPYVYSIFESMYGEHLKKVIPVPRVSKKLLGVVIPKPKRSEEPYVPQVGDVVAFAQDEEGACVWTKENDNKPQEGPHARAARSRWSEGYWFGWVTKIRGNKLSIVWLYGPSDTILRGGHYPWPNELFFSDHCNCSADSKPLLIQDVAGKVDVVFHPEKHEQTSEAKFFVRQKYRTDDPAFLTLKESDLQLGKCPCDEDFESPPCYYGKIKQDFSPGDTALYAPKKGKLLEPCVIVAFDDVDLSVTIRRLQRAAQSDANAKPNELLYTQQFEDVPTQKIIRRCYVRVFGETEHIEAPYDRNGIGDCFYIRSEILESREILPLQRRLPEKELRQGFQLHAEVPKPILRGMDLFCGGGNFGRGLEEGGVVKMKYAVDFDHAPLHSYRANMKNLGDTKLYLGSINNYLQDAIRGKYSEEKGIPRRDQVDFISAGSPCQGFSLANSRKSSFQALRKQSLVCSLATAIDVYRPKYAVLENVAGIASPRRTKGKDGKLKVENTYTTMLCAIVGMGYQCQSFLCDSWSHGNCQSRTRLVLAITKAGYESLSRPPRSHGHGSNPRGGALYRAPSGERFGSRETDGLCPFPFINTEQGWGYLPDIGDGHVGLSIKYPDHISPANPDTTCRLLMAHIPRFEKDNMNSWRRAIDSGRLHKVLWTFSQQGEKVRPDCRTYTRVYRDGLCRTITTTPTPQCSRTGRWVHPYAHRLVSIHEARVAQGYPDEDVLVGTPKNRLHVVGNSVARGVSLALGISVRRAYLASEVVEEEEQTGGREFIEEEEQAGGRQAYEVVEEEEEEQAGGRQAYEVVEEEEEQVEETVQGRWWRS
ncbi:S-adenosyl-L-methionine-dependent methyltransferase [Wilcoxina mikolae CBS 423.85]|nr:S-adenosyl-L-methionine-dependent methyltransferase [Wilcoxina mikolae CBS 423.85]